MTELNLDCLNLIFDELRKDKNSLYSCLLVNKGWSNAIVPILWKNYSWHDNDNNRKNKRLFRTILSFLPTSSKQLLSDNEVKLPSTILSNPPLFNYINFCNFPDNIIIKKIIKTMFGKTNYDTKGKLLKQVIYELFTSQCKNVKELYLQTSQPLLSFPGASTCFSQIYNLRIDMDSVNSDNVLGMAQICKNLYSLSIYNCSEDVPGLTSLIIAQKNLNELYLYTKKDIKELHQCLAISKFPDLKNLGVTGLSCFKELATLIEKTNGKISRIYVYTTDVIAKNSGMLIEAIANNCPKIKFLRTYLEPKDFINMKSLLLNCKHLENLRLDNMNYPLNESDRNIGDKLLNIFTEFSPESLINLTISEDWEYSVDALVRFRKYINEGVIMRFDCTKKRSSYWEFY